MIEDESFQSASLLSLSSSIHRERSESTLIDDESGFNF